MKKLFLPLWILGSLLLFLYSFTQVDLSLTLSEASFAQTIQKAFQYIGWFNRPLSTLIFVVIYGYLFMLYFWTIRLTLQKKLPMKLFMVVIISITSILMMSYNAFSYDLFNYIFDARIITFYHENPYIHKALDFPGDPMLSFMHWTHRTYPYGPVWLLLTVPLTFISESFFIITFYLFKLLMASFFLLAVFSIAKIAKVLKITNALLPVVVFAFNPFILTESLVSAHNDIVMMGIALYATFLILSREKAKGIILYVISAAIKFATVPIALGYLVLVGLKKEKYFLIVSLILMIVAVFLATLRTTFQPWYLLYVAPFAALLFQKYYIRIPFLVISIAGILYNIPHLYFGVWEKPVPEMLNWILILAALFSVTGVVISSFGRINEKNK